MTQMIKITTTKVNTINLLPGTKQTFPDKVQKKMLSILKTTVDDHSSASKAALSHTLLTSVRVDQCRKHQIELKVIHPTFFKNFYYKNANFTNIT